MVGVEEGVGDDVPRCVPGEVFVVDKDTHQFGDSERRVGLPRVVSTMYALILGEKKTRTSSSAGIHNARRISHAVIEGHL